MDTSALVGPPVTQREPTKFGPQGTLPPDGTQIDGPLRPAVRTVPLAAPISVKTALSARHAAPESTPPISAEPESIAWGVQPPLSFVAYSADETLVGVRTDDLHARHARADVLRTRKIGFVVLGVTLPLMIAVAGVLSIEEEPLSTLRPSSNVTALSASMKSLPRTKPMPAVVPTVAPLVAPPPPRSRRR